MSVSGGLNLSEDVPHGATRTFEPSCTHPSYDDLLEDLLACETENADLVDTIRSMKLRILDLEDEVRETRAGYPRS